MRWPWRRRRRNGEAETARRALAEAERKLEDTQMLAPRVRRAEVLLRREIERNGFAELMRAAFGRQP